MRISRYGSYACDVLVVITHPELPDTHSVLWFWPGLSAPLHFLITLNVGEAT